MNKKQRKHTHNRLNSLIRENEAMRMKIQRTEDENKELRAQQTGVRQLHELVDAVLAQVAISYGEKVQNLETDPDGKTIGYRLEMPSPRPRALNRKYTVHATVEERPVPVEPSVAPHGIPVLRPVTESVYVIGVMPRELVEPQKEAEEA